MEEKVFKIVTPLAGKESLKDLRKSNRTTYESMSSLISHLEKDVSEKDAEILKFKEIIKSYERTVTQKIWKNNNAEDRIINYICDFYNISKDHLLSQSRKGFLPKARGIVAYILNMRLKLYGVRKLTKILNKRNKSTIERMIKTIANTLETDKKIKRDFVLHDEWVRKNFKR